jgi:hypothetical protein
MNLNETLKIKKICKFAQLRKSIDGNAIYCTGAHGKNPPIDKKFRRINDREICIATRFEKRGKYFLSFVDYTKMELCNYKTPYVKLRDNSQMQSLSKKSDSQPTSWYW